MGLAFGLHWVSLTPGISMRKDLCVVVALWDAMPDSNVSVNRSMGNCRYRNYRCTSVGWSKDRRPRWVVLAIVHHDFSIPMPHLCAKSAAFHFCHLSVAVQMFEMLTLSASATPKSCTGSFSFGNNVVFSEVSRVEMNRHLGPLSTGIGASRTSP